MLEITRQGAALGAGCEVYDCLVFTWRDDGDGCADEIAHLTTMTSYRLPSLSVGQHCCWAGDDAPLCT